MPTQDNTLDKFADIKVGDEVGVYVNFGWNGRIAKTVEVTSVTPKRFKSRDVTYRKSDGCEVGGNSHQCYLLDEYFIGKIAEGKLLIRHSDAMFAIRRFGYKYRIIDNADLETVERIAGFLDGEISKLEEKK